MRSFDEETRLAESLRHSPAVRSRINRMMESWRVLSSERDQAALRNDDLRRRAIETAMKIVDACVSIEERFTTDPDRDQLVLARLREIAAERNIFRPAPEEGDADLDVGEIR